MKTLLVGLLGAAVMGGALFVDHRRALESERRAAELEQRTAALARSMNDLRGRPATERVIERERWTAPPAPEPAAPSDARPAGPSAERQLSEEAKAAMRRKKREIFEKCEGQFNEERVDPVWSRETEQSLHKAIGALPSGLGTIESVVSKSERSRIEATFHRPEQYNQFFKALFMMGVDGEGASAGPRSPLFRDHGGIFTPFKEPTADGKFHVVIFVDRPHPPPADEGAPPR